MSRRSLFQVLIILIIFGSFVTGQTRKDPRTMGLGGAYGTASRGLFCIDYNPANLVLDEKEKVHWLIGGANLTFYNNMLNFTSYNKYNGQDLEANDGELKNKLIADLPSDGLRIFTDMHLPLPLLNVSWANKAITSDLILISDIGLPRGVVRFLIDGNPVDWRLKMDFEEESIALMQYAYSVAFPLGDINFGISLKYLQGIAYLGLNPDSSYGYIETTLESMTGEGHYLFQQGLGGHGFGIDLGINYGDPEDLLVGLSITNLFANIRYNGSTIISRNLDENKILPWGGDFYLYEYSIDEARFDKFYKGSAFDQVFNGKGKNVEQTADFKIKYPSLVRLSLLKKIHPEAFITSDFIAGFEDRLFSYGAWKWALGAESTYYRHVPLRIGVAVGGKQHKSVHLGSGLHFGFFHLNYAIGFSQALTLSKAKGLDFALNAFITKNW